ncbi:MAG: FliI/YscN family ATPase [Verrucomicrobiae bacterium]|nr:FliI/YscN family ATPase [Verrucomicrobiae bacterium]HAQ98275.1 EscN/YscN/HrcN family type III secretion system ATPase [Verrucomicrobiales bacterium]HBP56555.1 EscN/YscN/HrcN family type III secretion system ATPase [Verrucomicrobiales bacterium]HCP37983.1 EscN/YscN/HrcN family type III secretion system ATPase [Verrucomicrobiales bacterium]
MSEVESLNPVARTGKVIRVTGSVVQSSGPLASIGDLCRIKTRDNHTEILAEVVGFQDRHVLLMPFSDMEGVQPGSAVVSEGKPLQVRTGFDLMGRILNSLGEPIDDLGPIWGDGFTTLKSSPPHPMKRHRITERFRTGIKVLDTFVPCGVGQRLGIFAGSGVGKSTLLGMIAGHAEADVNVIALIGERGRELREFVERDLSPEARKKSVVIVATSDETPIMRLKGAYTAMAVSEYFRDQGSKVLLMMDSVTRFAMAQREVGLAAGELPATKGYPPSVFATLPQLLERAGAGENGSITGLFTVLVEGDDMNDPVADHVRSILDGHVVLNRDLAFRNHYPAIDVLQSVSRLFGDLSQGKSQEWIHRAREAMAEYHEHRDILSLGAYKKGSNEELDRAIRLRPSLNTFLKQTVKEGYSVEESHTMLEQVFAGEKYTVNN